MQHWIQLSILLIIFVANVQWIGCTNPEAYIHKAMLKWDASKNIDDTNITLNTITEANNQFYPIIKEMVTTRFFRTFKVDIESECPFWAMQRLCGVEGGCSVCKCDEKEVPIPWKITTTNHINRQGALFRGIEGKKMKWKDQNKDSWFPNAPESHLTYVNLLNNPEANTGYSSKDASRIWLAIYTENCFKGGNVNDMCLEERFFYRLLSGLHSAITTKIATYHFKKSEYLQPLDGSPPPKVFDYHMWDPKIEMFEFMIQFPERLQNMYFLYSTTLRAIQKARQFFLDYDYSTGNSTDDAQTKALLSNLLSNDKLQLKGSDENPFIPKENEEVEDQCCYDETCLFKSHCDAKGQQQKFELIQQMREHFYNISRLMDCVGCEKCRMWAKLQMLGLSVSMRILFAETPTELAQITSQLNRNEIIALFNSFKQQAQSIADLQRLLNMAYRKRLSRYIAYSYFIFIGGVVCWLLCIIMASCIKRIRRRLNRRQKKKKE